MTKNELVREIATVAQSTIKDASCALESFITVVNSAMERGESVKISGFGNFEVVNRPARNGINPKTKAPLLIPATKAVKFKVGKNLKESAKS